LKFPSIIWVVMRRTDEEVGMFQANLSAQIDVSCRHCGKLQRRHGGSRPVDAPANSLGGVRAEGLRRYFPLPLGQVRSRRGADIRQELTANETVAIDPVFGHLVVISSKQKTRYQGDIKRPGTDTQALAHELRKGIL
jgi:hypothetical protein